MQRRRMRKYDVRVHGIGTGVKLVIDKGDFFLLFCVQKLFPVARTILAIVVSLDSSLAFAPRRRAVNAVRSWLLNGGRISFAFYFCLCNGRLFVVQSR